MAGGDLGNERDETGHETGQESGHGSGVIRVHYWAAAKAAAGVAGDDLPVDGAISLSEVLRRSVALHPGTKLADVLRTCSALLGDRPVSAEDPDEVVVPAGATVEFLPPFAGG